MRKVYNREKNRKNRVPTNLGPRKLWVKKNIFCQTRYLRPNKFSGPIFMVKNSINIQFLLPKKFRFKTRTNFRWTNVTWTYVSNTSDHLIFRSASSSTTLAGEKKGQKVSTYQLLALSCKLRYVSTSVPPYLRSMLVLLSPPP